jgi:hypothetical protein
MKHCILEMKKYSILKKYKKKPTRVNLDKFIRLVIQAMRMRYIQRVQTEKDYETQFLD